MSDQASNVTALLLAQDFAKALGDRYNAGLDLEILYFLARRKEEGFDAIMQINEGDKWGYDVHWCALRGTPEQIAATIHNEKRYEVEKGVEYRTLKFVMDLNHPIENQWGRSAESHKLHLNRTLIAPTFIELVKKLDATLGKEAAKDCATERSFSHVEMKDQINAAKPALAL